MFWMTLVCRIKAISLTYYIPFTLTMLAFLPNQKNLPHRQSFRNISADIYGYFRLPSRMDPL